MSAVGSSSWRGSWRVALRLARREASRDKGRTALVAAMVGVPVLLVVTLSTLFHTNDISPREGLTAMLGQSQAVVSTEGTSRSPITQGPLGNGWSSNGDPVASAPWTAAELSAAVRGRVLPLTNLAVRLSGAKAALPVQARELPVNDPATKGIVQVTSGRLPRGPGEIAITRSLQQLGWGVGTKLQDLDTSSPKTVVGIYSSLGMSGSVREVLALPGSLTPPSPDDAANASYLVVRDSPISWAEVQRLNAVGLVVASRQVIEHPPATSSLSDEQRSSEGGDQAATRGLLAIVIVSIVIEVVLLAGPAFAVGVRRRRRDLALLAATGSTPRDIRRGVLAHAGVIGAGAALLGALLGVPAAGLTIPIAKHFGAAFGPFDWRPSELLVTVVIGAAAAVIAALVPAAQAARADVATVLSGRRGTVRSRAGWPLLGLALLVVGSAIALTKGTRAGGEFWVAGGTIVMVLGAVGATPWMVGLIGRLATRLPLPLRLATRDAARQRARTAPAVAAIMASVIGITALAIGFASDTKQSRRDYEPISAPGVATVSINDQSSSSPGTLAAAINAAVPNRQLFNDQSIGNDYQPNADPTSLQSHVVIAPPGCTVEQSDINGQSSDETCVQKWHQSSVNTEVAADDVGTLAALGVHLDAATAAVLNSGGVLVAQPAALGDHQVLLAVVQSRADGNGQPQTVLQKTLPAAVLPALPKTSQVAYAVMTPATAARMGLTPFPIRIAIGGPVLTKAQQSAIESRVVLQGSDIYVERGFHQAYGVVLAALIGFGGLIVLIAAITATGLAMSEARPDLATLAAIGARPRTRRFVAAAQSLVVGLLGTVLGVALGFVPGLAVTWPLTSSGYQSQSSPPGVTGLTDAASAVGTGPVIAIPWLALLAVVIAVPLIAALASGLFTRSRLPMVRRLAT